MLLQRSGELEIIVAVTEFFGLKDIAWPPVKGHQKCSNKGKNSPLEQLYLFSHLSLDSAL